jgi:hypothetical protein
MATVCVLTIRSNALIITSVDTSMSQTAITPSTTTRTAETTSHYGSFSATQPIDNEYDNVDALLSKNKSHYKDWKDAENPAPVHYAKIDVNQQAIDADYVDINNM